MERLTVWDEELGSYLKENRVGDIDVVNALGRYEDDNENKVVAGINAADAIHQIMSKQLISRTELANRIGKHRNAVAQFLGKKDGSMRYCTFHKLADALGYEIVLMKK